MKERPYWAQDQNYTENMYYHCQLILAVPTVNRSPGLPLGIKKFLVFSQEEGNEIKMYYILEKDSEITLLLVINNHAYLSFEGLKLSIFAISVGGSSLDLTTFSPGLFSKKIMGIKRFYKIIYQRLK